jgi:uncharacterized membrane protein YoaK (UPF0700 family)
MQPTRTLFVLLLTSLSAGLVDVLSFVKLGGIFTSAMTGNLALLGFYAATGAASSAIRSLLALLGFVAGCAFGMILSRRGPGRLLRRLLILETVIIAVCAAASLQSAWLARDEITQAVILGLAVAMGLQSVVGVQLKQTNVVFTSTLIKIVSAAIGAARTEGSSGERQRDAAVVAAYLTGALLAGATITANFTGALFIPALAIAAAFVCAEGAAD